MKPQIIKKAFCLQLVLVLILEFTLGTFAPNFGQAQNNKQNKNIPTHPGEAHPEISEQLSQDYAELISKPEDKYFVSKIENIANGIEINSDIKDAGFDFDVFQLSKQRVEIYEYSSKPVVYNLNEYQVELPYLAFTQVLVQYNPESKELIFEASRGADNEGKNGTLVARHIIADLELASFTQDSEILSLIDRKGHLHVIDMNYAAEQVFKSQIPVFKNLWVPTVPLHLENTQISIEYITRGTQPILESQVTEDSVVQRDPSTGKIIFTAGDLVVTYKTENNTKINIYSRQVIHEQISRKTQLLEWLAYLVSGDTKNLEITEKLLLELEQSKQTLSAIELQQNLTESIRDALLNIRSDQIKSLSQKIDNSNKYANRRYDKFNYEEWKKSFEELQKTAKSDFLKENQTKDIEASQLQNEIKNNWTKYIKQKHNFTQKQSKLKKLAAKVTDIRVLSSFFAVIGGAYLIYPYLHENYEILRQIKTIVWMYETLYFDVLKDAEYRNILMLSMGSLVCILPLTVAASIAIGKTLKSLTSRTIHSNSLYAQKMRDLARNWAELNSWQRITSFGMRIYGRMVYPYLKSAIEDGLNQKVFFSAFENGINPFSTYKTTENGKIKKKFIGLNKVNLKNENTLVDIQNKSKLQASILEQKARAKNLAWVLATLAISEREKIDPATLLLISSGEKSAKIDPAILGQILADKQTQKDWQILAHDLYKEIYEIKEFGIEHRIQDLDASEIGRFYAVAEHYAQKIKKNPTLLKNAKLIWLRFKEIGSDLKRKLPLVTLGAPEAIFLKKVFTNEFVSEQVKKEFVIDHLILIGVFGLYGERANLNDAKHLSADQNGLLWTSHAHWYDVFMNCFAHFFLAGGQMALVYQKVQPKEESKYLPIEDFELKGSNRVQGFWLGMKDWAYDLRPTKSDLGNYILKRFVRRVTTVQAGLTMMVLFRVLIWDQPISDSFLAWSLFFIAGHWYYGWIWDPIQRGNNLESERFKENNENLKQARYLISQGLKEHDQERSTELIQEGYSRLYQLYQMQNKSALNQINKLISGSSTENISKQQAHDLIMYSLKNPPIYTLPNSTITWLTTWGGAVFSTINLIPLTVIAMDPELINQPGLIEYWIKVSAILYTAAYLSLAKKPWQFYIKIYERINNKYTASKEEAQENDFNLNAISCNKVFSK